MILATMFDNLALAYLLGHCSDSACASKFVRVYLPGVMYFGLCAGIECLRRSPLMSFNQEVKDVGTGASLGIILYTVIHELAPEMTSDIQWVSGLTLIVAFLFAPWFLSFVKSKEKQPAKDYTMPLKQKLCTYLGVGAVIIAVSHLADQEVLPAKYAVPALAGMGTGMLTWSLLLEAYDHGERSGLNKAQECKKLTSAENKKPELTFKL